MGTGTVWPDSWLEANITAKLYQCGIASAAGPDDQFHRLNNKTKSVCGDYREANLHAYKYQLLAFWSWFRVSIGACQMMEFADFLILRAYVRVPLTRSGVGHFHTVGTLNGRAVEVLVDTGAACTVVAMSIVRDLGLRSEWLNSDAGGAGGALDQYQIEGGC